MGTKADYDLWGQALAFESQYGNRGPEVLSQRIIQLQEAGDPREAEFLSEVVTCLTNLHAIRLEIDTPNSHYPPTLSGRTSGLKPRVSNSHFD